MAKDKICIEAFQHGHPNFKGPILWGTSNNNLEKAFEYKRKGINFIYIDMPYFDKTRVHFLNNDLSKSYFRVILNDIINNSFKEKLPTDRFLRLGLTINPWKKEGDKILILGSSAVVNNYFGGSNWLLKTKLELEKQTKKRIIIRSKTSSKNVNKFPTINDELKNCYATVSLISLASIQGLLEGIPCFCHPISPCIILGNSINSKITNIKYSENRIELFSKLSYSQFTLEEIFNGLPGTIFQNFSSFSFKFF